MTEIERLKAENQRLINGLNEILNSEGTPTLHMIADRLLTDRQSTEAQTTDEFMKGVNKCQDKE